MFLRTALSFVVYGYTGAGEGGLFLRHTKKLTPPLKRVNKDTHNTVLETHTTLEHQVYREARTCDTLL